MFILPSLRKRDLFVDLLVLAELIQFHHLQISGRDGPPGQPCSECRSIVCTTCGGYGNSSSTANNSYDNKVAHIVILCVFIGGEHPLRSNVV